MVSLVTTNHELCITQEVGPGVITTIQVFQLLTTVYISFHQQHDLAVHAKQ